MKKYIFIIFLLADNTVNGNSQLGLFAIRSQVLFCIELDKSQKSFNALLKQKEEEYYSICLNFCDDCVNEPISH